MEFKEVHPMMKVVIRDFNDMAAEFGIRASGTIDCPYGFNDHVMFDTCGKIATVVGIHEPDAFALIIDGRDTPEVDSYHPTTFRPFTWSDLKPVDEKPALSVVQ